jgi:hypothetical protein
MAKVSKATMTTVDDYGAVVDRHEELGGYTAAIVEMREDVDAGPLLKGLPDDRCQCPHWGQVIKGRLTWQYPDHDEVCEAGDLFYVPAGHSQTVEAGTEFLLFSPTEKLNETDAAMARNMQAMQGA